MKKVFYIAIIFLALILQGSLMNIFVIKGVAPDLVLVLILVLVILNTFYKNWWLVVFSGIGLELLVTLDCFGIISISLLLTVFLIDRLNQKTFSFRRTELLAILATAGVALYYLLLFSIFYVLNIELFFGWLGLLIKLSYDLILAFLFLYVFKKWFQKLFY